MRKAYQHHLLRLAVAGLTAMLASGIAHVTDGYFQDGYGARQKALAGSGVADGRDATTISLNPAGLVNVPNEATASISINKADRAFTGSGPVSLVRLGGANHLWRRVPPSELSIELVANGRRGRATGPAGAP